MDEILFRGKRFVGGEWAVGSLKQSEQKAGRWIETDDYDAWKCSECDEYFCFDEGTPQDNKYYYCPNCGAKMRMENG